MKLENVCRSRSPTDHVTCRLEDIRWRIHKHHNKPERKLFRRIKLVERHLAQVDSRIMGDNRRLQELEDQENLSKQYRQLCEAQSEFINAQNQRISDLELQGALHTAEIARILKLNDNLSATLNSQEITIHAFEQRTMSDMNHDVTGAATAHPHQLSVSSCLEPFDPYDPKLAGFSTDDNTFITLLPYQHGAEATPECIQMIADDECMLISSNSSTISQRQSEESGSPLWPEGC